MEVSVFNIKGEDTGRKVSLNDTVFGIEPNDHAIYLDVKQYLANQRQGTHSSKGRSQLSGSTRKLGRQKGGGGARPGDIKSGVRVGGGRMFGPTPRDYSFKLNKKVKKLARKSALTYRLSDNGIIVVDNLMFDDVKTRNIIELLDNFKLSNKKMILVVKEPNKNIYLSSRNLRDVKVINACDLSTYDIMWASTLMFEKDSIDVLEKIIA